MSSKFTKDIPEFLSVRQVVNEPLDKNHEYTSVVLICPDVNCGRKGKYSVIRVFYQTGKTRVIGRELPLMHARKIAHRPAKKDGMPL